MITTLKQINDYIEAKIPMSQNDVNKFEVWDVLMENGYKLNPNGYWMHESDIERGETWTVNQQKFVVQLLKHSDLGLTKEALNEMLKVASEGLEKYEKPRMSNKINLVKKDGGS